MAINISHTQQLTSATSAGGLQTSTTVLASNPGRTSFMIQNQDNTHELYIAFGVTASSSVYHLVLPVATGAHNGTGGSVAQENGIVFSGLITCYSAGTPSYTVFETSDN